uniref:Ionotropic glutamate receptor C-terminal domain-containing protein n=1 Tax=Plectus sambesii TaxID=2011161 RepID=A0A914WAS7_9BILA
MSRVFKLGYVETLDEPFIYPCLFHSTPENRCSKPGISGEIWLEIAALLNYTLQFVQTESYGGYEPDANGGYPGVLGLVQNGTIDATLTFQSLRPTRFDYFNYSELAQSYESGLIIGEIVDTKSHIQVQVFDWLVVLLLGIFLGLVGIFNHLVLSRTRHSTFHSNWININPTLLRFSRLQCSLPNGVLALAFTIVNLTYFAGFRSQAMMASQRSTDRIFQEFFAHPRSKVITTSDSALHREHRLAIFGSSAAKARSRIIVEPDLEVIAKTLCANPNIAYYTELSGNVSALGFKGMRAYIVSKIVPAWELAKINDIILKLFNIDHNEAYLYPKYNIFPRNVNYDGHIFLHNMSISFNQLTEGFLFVAAAFSLATLLFIVEVLHYKRSNKQKKRVTTPLPDGRHRYISPILISTISNEKWFNHNIDVSKRYSRA